MMDDVGIHIMWKCVEKHASSAVRNGSKMLEIPAHLRADLSFEKSALKEKSETRKKSKFRLDTHVFVHLCGRLQDCTFIKLSLINT